MELISREEDCMSQDKEAAKNRKEDYKQSPVLEGKGEATSRGARLRRASVAFLKGLDFSLFVMESH